MAAGTLCSTIARATRLVNLVSVLRLDAPTANPSALYGQTVTEQASPKQGCQMMECADWRMPVLHGPFAGRPLDLILLSGVVKPVTSAMAALSLPVDLQLGSNSQHST